MIDEKKLINAIKETYPPMYNDFGMEFNTFVPKVEEMINSQPKVGEWIPCSERLPEDESAKYLCCDSFGNIHMYGYSKDLYRFDIYDFMEFRNKVQPGFYDYNSKLGFRHCDEVIAWQPLPEPYKSKL